MVNALSDLAPPACPRYFAALLTTSVTSASHSRDDGVHATLKRRGESLSVPSFVHVSERRAAKLSVQFHFDIVCFDAHD